LPNWQNFGKTLKGLNYYQSAKYGSTGKKAKLLAYFSECEKKKSKKKNRMFYYTFFFILEYVFSEPLIGG